MQPDAQRHARYLLDYRGSAHIAVQTVTGGSALKGFMGWRAQAGGGATQVGALRLPSLRSQHLGGVADFARWAKRQANGRRTVLLVLTHGTAPMASPAAPLGRLLVSAGLDGGIETAACLAQLRRGLADDDKPSVCALFLETCYAATLDNLWDCRGVAGTLVGSPAEIPSPGIAWDQLLRDLDAAGWDGWLSCPHDAARACRELAALRAIEACALPIDHIPDLRGAVSAMVTAALDELATAARAARWARARGHGPAPRGCTVRLYDLATALEGNAQGAALREAARALSVLLREAGDGMPAGDAGAPEGGLGQVSVALPVPADSNTLARYGTRCAFAVETNYSSLLDSLADYHREMAPALPWNWSP